MILPIFQNIAGYPLDEQQQKIALEESSEVMAIAGAGSGKTMTILGRIHYLIEEKHVLPSEILCISFTRKSSESLKEKCKHAFGYDIEVKTFHRLALDILNLAQKDYKIVSSDYLEYLITEYLAHPEEPLLSMLLCYFHLSSKEKYQAFYRKNPILIEQLKKEISTFIHVAKANNKDEKDFAEMILKQRGLIFRKNRETKWFLQITLYLYLTYKQELISSGSLDLDDIIIEATKLVKEKRINLLYKQIIIDEFQDTSLLRFSLIESIKNMTNAKLLVVGDDFQSIYRFSGCDVSLFLSFPKYYPQAKVMKIETTYRNADELVKVAGSFVMKNPLQQKKEMHSKKHMEKPIKVVFYHQARKDFTKLLEYLIKKGETNILVLSRNNKDIDTVLNKDMHKSENGMITYEQHKEVSLQHLTIHKSKGLEQDTVILIHLTSLEGGFPGAERKTYASLLTQKNQKVFPFDEERRLFYVALTRTKGNIYLFTDNAHPSIFVKELLKYKEVEVIRL